MKSFLLIFVMMLNCMISKSSAQGTTEEQLNKNIFRITLSGGGEDFMLADKVEFDPAENAIYSIERREGSIQYRTQAWKWLHTPQEDVLRFQLFGKNQIDVQFTSISDSIWIGKVSKKSTAYAELIRLLGQEPLEINIRFEPRKSRPKEGTLDKMMGMWRYVNLGFEFVVAGTEMTTTHYVHIKNNNQIELRDNNGKSLRGAYQWKTSSQGNYIRVIDPETKKETIHFVYGTSDVNLFLTCGYEGEIKNMQLKKARDFMGEGFGFSFYHKKGASIPVSVHRTYNMIQEVEKGADGIVSVRRKNLPLPEKIEGAYPLVYSSFSIPDVYLKPGVYVNADNPEIKAFTKQLMEGKQFTNQHELVKYVIKACAARLRYGNSELIPNASDALKAGIANCIGYAHLPAAVLRNLGVPTRNIRVYNTGAVQTVSLFKTEASGSFRVDTAGRIPWIPHYILEVFYPSLNQWVSFDPQTRLDFVQLNSVVLYESPDWDMAKHRASRPLAEDPNLVILGNDFPRPGSNRKEIALITQISPEQFRLEPGPVINVFTEQDVEGISSVGYFLASGQYIPFIKDDQDDKKWSLYYSTLKKTSFNYLMGELLDIGGDAIEVVDKFGTATSYQRFQSGNFAKYQFIFDLMYYKTMLSDCMLKDPTDGFLEFAFCGDDVYLFDRNKPANALPEKHTYEIRINARRGIYIDINRDKAKKEPLSFRVGFSENQHSIKIGNTVYDLVKENYCLRPN